MHYVDGVCLHVAIETTNTGQSDIHTHTHTHTRKYFSPVRNRFEFSFCRFQTVINVFRHWRLPISTCTEHTHTLISAQLSHICESKRKAPEISIKRKKKLNKTTENANIRSAIWRRKNRNNKCNACASVRARAPESTRVIPISCNFVFICVARQMAIILNWKTTIH